MTIKRYKDENQLIFVHRVTDSKSESEAVVAEPCAFGGIIIRPDGSNDITVNIYNNASAASGKHLIPEDTVIKGIEDIVVISVNPPLDASNGIYVEISVADSGTCAYQVIYDQGDKG